MANFTAMAGVVVRSRKVLAGMLALGRRALRAAVVAAGVLALIMVLLAFTALPFHAHRALGTAAGLCREVPERIIVLGGSGMPSGPELLRLHYAAQMATLHPAAAVTVVHPTDTAVIGAMVRELVLRGVSAARIDTVTRGNSTREQVLHVAQTRPTWLARRIALVTAPENMYRSVRAFRKVGFTSVGGVPAFDNALFNDLRTDHGRTGGRAHVPDVGGNLDLRYNFWNRLKLQVTCLREYAAIGYYRINGWI